jgi:hypothetical protein
LKLSGRPHIEVLNRFQTENRWTYLSFVLGIILLSISHIRLIRGDYLCIVYLSLIPCSAAMPAIYPLDDRGQRGRPISAPTDGEAAAQFKIGPPHATVWYEIDYSGVK